MTTYCRRHSAACVTAALMLTLAAVPTTADAVSAESQPKRGSARALTGCADATFPVEIAPGYEGLYIHSANVSSGCSVVTNVGNLTLQLSGGLISAPAHFDTPAGWAAETTAQQIRSELPPGSVVVLPGESAVLYQPPPEYTVDVVPLHVAQEAEFAQQYGLGVLAERDEGRIIPLSNKFGNAINKCAKATRDTWKELGQATGVESIADIFDKAKGLPKCKTAFSMLDPDSPNPDKPPIWERWHRNLNNFDVKWNTQLSDDLATRGAKILSKIPRG
ncbi:hypothetical protein ACFWBF_37200 [Streptomyces sp. NPDC060028]|uniref:hypothetical protein n=1 Tax=Streptomyces sp. NPDC060028 TaxID=3347041 RepID=UPI0036A68D0C